MTRACADAARAIEDDLPEGADAHTAPGTATAAALLIAALFPVPGRESRGRQSVAAASTAVAGPQGRQLAADQIDEHTGLIQHRQGPEEIVRRIAVDEGAGARQTALGRRGAGLRAARGWVAVVARRGHLTALIGRETTATAAAGTARVLAQHAVGETALATLAA